MKPEVLPQAPLNLFADLVRLAPPETSTKDHIDATLKYLEARQDRWTVEQNLRLQRAEKRIKLCALLNGMLMGIGLAPDYSVQHKHFRWCPFEDWMGSEYSTIPELFEPLEDQV